MTKIQNELFCPICKHKLDHVDEIESKIYSCKNITYNIAGICEPHYFVDWESYNNNDYPWYECVIWQNKEKIFCLEVEDDKNYCISKSGKDNWEKLASIKVDHEYRPINEVLKRFEDLIVFI